jgi:PAS domain S-box-containing protein
MEGRELLIIDDDTTLHGVLRDVLHTLGITTFSTYTGREGLAFLDEHRSIGVVLTDVRLPDLDGLTVLSSVKQRNPYIQVILMTAFSDVNLAVQALRLGADDFLEKPLQVEGLAAALNRGFERQHVQVLSRRLRDRQAPALPGVVRCTSDGAIEDLSPEAETLLDLTRDKALGKTLFRLSGLQPLRAFFRPSTEAASPMSVEAVIHGKALLIFALPAPKEAARLVVFLDLTEEKRLQEELNALSVSLENRVAERTRNLSSELDFSQRLLDAAGVLIAVVDERGKLVRLNKFAESLARFSRAEAEHVFSGFVEHKESPLSRIFDPHSQDELTDFIAELPTRDGTRRLLSWSTRHLPYMSGRQGRLIIGIDVTEQKLLESRLKNLNVHLEDMVESRSLELRQKNELLIHTARLASLGEISAGIAHEMKQPLNVISITADLIRLLHRNHTLTDDLLLGNLDKIRLTVGRMANTLNHLRGFTHIDASAFEPVVLRDVIEGALAILGEQIRLDDIDLQVEVDANLPPVMGNQNQMEQVLVNLLQNARQAVQEKCEKHSGGYPLPAHERRILLHAGLQNGGQNVFVDVIDSGIGMSEEVKRHIFEPFFTTKKADQGTGLGLAISMNIVQTHGGSMEIESEPQQGTTFRLMLPAATDSAAAAPER